MKKQGFTMLEMLAVIIVLVFIAFFSFPLINSIVNGNKTSKYNIFNKTLNNAAEAYIELNIVKYNKGELKYISAKTLIEEGLLKKGLVNPVTKKAVYDEDGIIEINKNNDGFEFSYVINEYISISKIEDLIDISISVKNGNTYKNKFLILTKDLDFKEEASYRNPNENKYSDIYSGQSIKEILTNESGTGFLPIGTAEKIFEGQLIGNGFKISNLYINRNEENVGLFSVIKDSSIKHIKISGFVNGSKNIGLLAGQAINSSIENINADVIITNLLSPSSNIGGIIGSGQNLELKEIEVFTNIRTSGDNIGGIVGLLTNSTVSLAIQSGNVIGKNNVGGIFGILTDSNLNDSSSKGKISGQENIGGIIGELNTSILSKIESTMSISGTNKVGGITGNSSNSTIKKSYYNGDILATSQIGGISGLFNSGSELLQVFSSGTLTGNTDLGGLIGNMVGNSKIENCYSISTLRGSTQTGGLVGNSSSSIIRNTHYNGNIIAATNLGGIIGIANGTTISDSYYNNSLLLGIELLGSSTNNTINNSSGLTTNLMKQVESFNSWNFIEIWQLSNNLYPTLVEVDPSENNIYEFAYKDNYQEFIVPKTGYYKIELWGAQGGATAATSHGGYTSGTIYLEKNEKIYVYVGEAGKIGTLGINATSTVGIGATSTFNGGGAGGSAGGSTTYPYSNYRGGASGGGATDIRLVSGNWNNSNGLNSRIMVAAGGGGSTQDGDYDNQKSKGGGIIGNLGSVATYFIGTYESDVVQRGTGGTQISAGLQNGSFGIGGLGATTSNTTYCNGHCGGGGGYYGGGGGKDTQYRCHFMGGGGGSSFISGYAGVNAITNATTITHSNNTLHYSGKYFINGKMESGVNEGNGKATITYLSKNKPERKNEKLNNIRYIKNCINGNNLDSNNHWVELQAVANGVNVAKNKTIASTIISKVLYPYTRINDGDITSIEWAESNTGGLQCITIDLENTYNLDEITIWHIHHNGRIYYQNTLSVGSINVAGSAPLSTILHTYSGTNGYTETSEGKRYSAYE